MNKKAIFGIGSALLIIATTYLAFGKKDANGLSWYKRVTSPGSPVPSIMGYAKKKGEWVGTNGKEYNKDWNSAVNSAGVTIYVKKSDSNIDGNGRVTAAKDTNVYTIAK